eukprot:TRINITY_DN39587_c0_g1_i1.p1 TRINITY_DN39587_c0_g1~~TRINITY_DN39587_c0_g1_i1.p1  ORF type:complete len:128 (+),score=7.49 TRINITY_DN39587_c0_g1_i1:371-754(+)
MLQQGPDKLPYSPSIKRNPYPLFSQIMHATTQEGQPRNWQHIQWYQPSQQCSPTSHQPEPLINSSTAMIQPAKSTRTIPPTGWSPAHHAPQNQSTNAQQSLELIYFGSIRKHKKRAYLKYFDLQLKE